MKCEKCGKEMRIGNDGEYVCYTCEKIPPAPPIGVSVSDKLKTKDKVGG